MDNFLDGFGWLVFFGLLLLAFYIEFQEKGRRAMKDAATIVAFVVSAFAYTGLIGMATALDPPFDFVVVFGLLWPLILMMFEGLPERSVPQSGFQWPITTGLALYLSWVTVRNIQGPTWEGIFGASMVLWPGYLMATMGLNRRLKGRKNRGRDG